MKKLYSVTMTKEELRLFSEFLVQKNYNEDEDLTEDEMSDLYWDARTVKNINGKDGKFQGIGGIDSKPSSAYKNYDENGFKNRKAWQTSDITKEGIRDNENLTSGEKAVLSQDWDIQAKKINFANFPEYMPKSVSKKHRMSKRYIKALDKEGQDYMDSIMPIIENPNSSKEDLYEADKYHNKKVSDLKDKVKKAQEIIDNEDYLKDSGYIKENTSKITEWKNRKNLTPQDYYNITKKRKSLQESYTKPGNEKLVSKKIKRKLDKDIIKSAAEDKD